MSRVAITEETEKVKRIIGTEQKLPLFRLLFIYLSIYLFIYLSVYLVFAVNLKLVRKSSIFLFLGVTLTYMMTWFKKSNRFYCVRAAKTIKSKYVVKDQILLTVASNFDPFFKF